MLQRKRLALYKFGMKVYKNHQRALSL